jgi:hypothetical protein
MPRGSGLTTQTISAIDATPAACSGFNVVGSTLMAAVWAGSSSTFLSACAHILQAKHIQKLMNFLMYAQVSGDYMHGRAHCGR